MRSFDHMPALFCCRQKASRPTPGAPLSAISGHKRYNTLHFQIESRVPTGRSRPCWMTQRKVGRAAFGSVPCGEPRFFCRSAHPAVRLIPAGGFVRHTHHRQSRPNTHHHKCYLTWLLTPLDDCFLVFGVFKLLSQKEGTSLVQQSSPLFFIADHIVWQSL